MTIAETLRLGSANLGDVFEPQPTKYVPARLLYPLENIERDLIRASARLMHEQGARAWEQVRGESAHGRVLG